MIRVFVVYEAEPDPERYERHAEICRQVPGVTFRHGRVFGTPVGEPEFHYYGEFEFADMDAFRAAAPTPEMGATMADAKDMALPFKVHFAEIA